MSALSKAATCRRTPKATARCSHNASSVIPNAIDQTLVIETRQFLGQSTAHQISARLV
jgi:hypothetical protein